MFLKTSIPVVGERIKAGDPLRGPICIIEKIQRVDRIDVENSDITTPRPAIRASLTTSGSASPSDKSTRFP